MNPLTFLALLAFSLLASLGLLLFAPDLLVAHGPLLALGWIAGMGLYVACAYLGDVLAAREQAELERWRAELAQRIEDLDSLRQEHEECEPS